ncbi:MAG: hypothetical protein LIO94_01195 [Clostridiales bacterium]|nr:hypothetical protein [Clostridiales bacterium]
MDKYEYNLKLEEIDKLVDQGDYKEAANLADSIEWRRVRNVRTLSLISEIYEAAGELEKSKEILVRAYRKSPVGRNVLYRLVEVTTALGQYDEALEYYSEYVQIAPHDNNRYILKYMIYKGRGSSAEDLISILEEYLGQEYTERWAYELATVYQQAGQMQKCLATCDDLVLWFHSGKYVRKALELKKRYAVLTPKQQQIYEVCMQEEAQSDYFEDSDEETTLAAGPEEADDEVIAENIIAETEKEIADEITARKAEMEKDAGAEAEGNAKVKAKGKAKTDTRVFSFAKKKAAPAASQQTRVLPDKVDLGELPVEEPDIPDPEPEEHDDLQVELARSVRKVISGVARKPELNEDDVPAAVEARLHTIQEVPHRKEPEPKAGRLSIDDILLSMGEKGRQTAEAARAQREVEMTAGQAEQSEVSGEQPELSVEKPEQSEVSVAEPQRESETVVGQPKQSETSVEQPEVSVVKSRQMEEAAVTDTAEDDVPKQMNPEPEKQIQKKTIPADEPEPVSMASGRSIAAAAAEELTREQLEAIRYSSNPEKFLKKRTSLPSYAEEENFGETRRIVNTKEELLEAARKELMATKTIRIPTEEVARAYSQTPEEVSSENGQDADRSQAGQWGSSEMDGAVPDVAGDGLADDRLNAEFPAEDRSGSGISSDDRGMDDGVLQASDIALEEEEDFDGDEYYDDPLTIAPYLRGLFKGFTEIEGLEDQIANAILQVMAKGEDRTSRNGNILIFGAHGSGKTTLAINIAKAITQEKGRKVAKMARIYAADLNRRDIAATIAKIAGGILIVEEAGDLDDNTVEQLTTAMEFRTDGLIVILEDEQRYVHNLLMNHPRFTMKFTAQIYLPVYTADELAMFAQQHANELDYMISEEGFEAIRQKVAEAASSETPMSVGDIIALTDRAIRHSNKFMRKMSMGKKRYDENDYVLLFARDFK